MSIYAQVQRLTEAQKTKFREAKSGGKDDAAALRAAKKSKGTYKIVRMFRNDHPSKTIRRGLTLEKAQAHCREPNTSSSTCTDAKGLALTRRLGPWFDGYEAE